MRKILKYPNPTMSLDKHYGGKILGDIWGYETVGIAQSQEEMDKHLANGGTPNWEQPGVQVTSCMAISTVKMVLTTAQTH